MRQTCLLILFLTRSWFSPAQTMMPVAGRVSDAGNLESLGGASISIYTGGNVSGLVSNKDGRFVINAIHLPDSVKVSMVGYHSMVIYADDIVNKKILELQLTVAPSLLKEIVVRPRSALEIIREAISKIHTWLPGEPFESKGFYREIIKDRDNYFSVAEAVFRAQYFPARETCKLQLIQGRSKEDITYTRLFEDFHPGGGPQSITSNNFIISRPDFLDVKKINDFIYKIDSLVFFDGEWLYSISFDQKPGIKAALEKGRLLIQKDDCAVVSYEAANSPLGMAYIKNLTGTDKIFAALLNIEFKRKGWKRKVDFTRFNDKWFMSHADAEQTIAYKQTKKDIDLNLTINIEILMTDLELPLNNEIHRDEEWKRKNIIANLPGVFDAAYWGNNNIISPTTSVAEIVAGIAKNNNDTDNAAGVTGWNYMNRNFFVSSQHADSIVLIPVMKCNWEDEQTAGMLFNEVEGDFSFETQIDLIKNSNQADAPDKGFQQAGIMVRDASEETENYFLLTAGSGGNASPKLFFKKTAADKSKTIVRKLDAMKGWLKMERKANTITAWFRESDTIDWVKVGEYEAGRLPGKIQLGLAAFARFAGDGPKMQPDMKAIFTKCKITQR